MAVPPSGAPGRPLSCSSTLETQVGLLVRSILSQILALLSKIRIVPLCKLPVSLAPPHGAVTLPSDLDLPTLLPRPLHQLLLCLSGVTRRFWQPLLWLTFHTVDKGIENYWMPYQSLRLFSGEVPGDCSFARSLISLVPKPQNMHNVDVGYPYLLLERAKSITLPKSVTSTELLFPAQLLTSPENTELFEKLDFDVKRLSQQP